MLTKSQHRLLLFIDGQSRANGYSPSYEEMRVHMRLGSKSGIARLVGGLEQRGFVARRAEMARAITVLRMPGDPPPGDPGMVAALLAAEAARDRFGEALAEIWRITYDPGARAVAGRALDAAKSRPALRLVPKAG